MSSNNNNSSDCVSENHLVFTIAQAKPSSTHVIVYFDEYEQTCKERINIIPLNIIAISDKKELSCVDKLFPNIRYISISSFYKSIVDRVKGALYKLIIEVKETKFDKFDYHHDEVFPVFNKALHDKLNPIHERKFSSEDIENLDIDPSNDIDI